MVEMSEHFAAHSKKTTFKRKSWNAIFKVLANIAASAPVQADGGAIQTIIDLCDNLLDKIAESRDIERKEYEAYVAEYDADREAAVTSLNETVQQIADLTTEINTLTKRINAARAEK